MSYLHKPVASLPILERIPPGCKAYFPFIGCDYKSLIGPYTGTKSGNVVWSNGFYGNQLNGFNSTSFVNIDSLASLYPCWLTVLAVGTGGTLAGFGSTISNEVAYMSWQTGYLHYFLRGANGFDTDLSVAINANDGLPHVFTIYSTGYASHRIYFDGNLVLNSTINVVSVTPNTFSVGGYRQSSNVLNPFSGSIIALLAGNSVLPNQNEVFRDLIIGMFSVLRFEDSETLECTRNTVFRTSAISRIGSRRVS